MASRCPVFFDGTGIPGKVCYISVCFFLGHGIGAAGRESLGIDAVSVLQVKLCLSVFERHLTIGAVQGIGEGDVHGIGAIILDLISVFIGDGLVHKQDSLPGAEAYGAVDGDAAAKAVGGIVAGDPDLRLCFRFLSCCRIGIRGVLHHGGVLQGIERIEEVLGYGITGQGIDPGGLASSRHALRDHDLGPCSPAVIAKGIVVADVELGVRLCIASVVIHRNPVQKG